MAHGSFAERLLYAVGLTIARVIYRVTVTGRENLPASGFLLLPTHITGVDAVILSLASPRRVRFIIAKEYYENRFLHPVLRLTGCIPITPARAKDAVRAAAEKIRAGEIVCVFLRDNCHAQAR